MTEQNSPAAEDWSGLAFPPPLAPMLAKTVTKLPTDETGAGWLYEPKWDGFRALLFRAGPRVELFSRSQRPLTRYFPELVEQALAYLPEYCVLDGEIIMIAGLESGSKTKLPRLDFDLLQQRLHPAVSRVRKLAAESPAVFVAFDLLAFGQQNLLDLPLAGRREQLTQVVSGATRLQVQHILVAEAAQRIMLTPATTQIEQAQQWFDQFEGAGLDGVVAKALDAPYTPNVRTMAKLKHTRTADCVVAGLRWHKTSTAEQELVGSLLLGLYAHGQLQQVGSAAAFSTQQRAELAQLLKPLVIKDLSLHPWTGQLPDVDDNSPAQRRPGARSRWNSGQDLSFVPLRPERVCEVGYDHMEGDRFRHITQFLRWRPDRQPQGCTYEQLEQPLSYDLAQVLTCS